MAGGDAEPAVGLDAAGGEVRSHVPPCRWNQVPIDPRCRVGRARSREARERTAKLVIVALGAFVLRVTNNLAVIAGVR